MQLFMEANESNLFAGIRQWSIVAAFVLFVTVIKLFCGLVQCSDVFHLAVF
jgi:hypothetical protein